MSNHTKECISRGYFKLNFTALPTDKFQLTEEYDQAQRNLLEVHSRHHKKECFQEVALSLILLPCQLTSFN